MKNKVCWGLLIMGITTLLAGCSFAPAPAKAEQGLYEKYEAEFIGTFDVKIQLIGYAESEESFTRASQAVYDKMTGLNQLFDIYHDYEGINNLKTVNDAAGKEPVKVDPEIIDLLLFCKEAYRRTGGLVNVAMGAPLRIWHDYRTEGTRFPANASLPAMDDLTEAEKHTDIEQVIIDKENNTVYLEDPLMSLDVGAVAKGYSAEWAKKAAKEAGLESAIINAGGNILTIGQPLDGIRQRWGIGIQDPGQRVDGTTNILDTIYLNDRAVVSSGYYERYYVVDGEIYHHIIDPVTLMPAKHYAAVTVVHEDSGIADYLSTAIFTAPYEKGLEVAKAHGAEVLWVFHDGSTKATEGYRKMSKMYSGYSSQDIK